MYQVIHQGQAVGQFDLFWHAWLHAFFLKSYSHIVGPDGDWIINPAGVN